MRGVAVKDPARSDDGSAWYSGERFPMTSCRFLSQLRWPFCGRPSTGAHQPGQVAVSCAARHDMPHCVHHNRGRPGVSDRMVKQPRKTRVVNATSNGRRRCRAEFNSIGAGTGPGVGTSNIAQY